MKNTFFKVGFQLKAPFFMKQFIVFVVRTWISDLPAEFFESFKVCKKSKTAVEG